MFNGACLSYSNIAVNQLGTRVEANEKVNRVFKWHFVDEGN